MTTSSDRLEEALARPGIRARQDAYQDRMIVTREKLDAMLKAMREGAQAFPLCGKRVSS